MGSGVWRSLPGSRPGRTAAAGTSIVGTCGQDLAHEGGPPARVSTWAATSARWARGAMSWLAR